MKSSLLFFISGLLTFTACNSSDNSFDASGVFEAEEVVVAAEANGRIIAFLAEEGAVLEAGQVIGKIDDTALALQKQEIIARLEALQAKTGSATPQVAVYQQQIAAQEDQIAVLQTQLDHLEKESKRFGQLVSAAAVPEKQLDDITAQIAVLEQQIHAATAQRGVLRQQIQSHQQQIALQNRGLLSEDAPLRAKLAQLEHQIAQCTITNPVSGTVISSFAEVGEYTGMGKALYKIANLDEMILRAYITGEQLSRIKINQSVRILTPGQETTGTPLTGQVTWISDKAEFTPKTIQTQEERAHLVYATRIKVKNDGTLKIGMYADLLFD
jgi:HlyD family secretion protein